jgi:hypothetical protein
MTIIAFDIETCPTDEAAFSSSQKDRLEQQLDYHRERSPDTPGDALSRKARSLHPFLGWICCISAVMAPLRGDPGTPRSLTAETPDEEAELLDAFWSGIGQVDKSVVWASFNGKRFDAPYIAARSARHGITPTRQDILNTYPYKQRPHADLSNLWPQPYGLDDLCDLLGVDTPKTEMDGSQVAGAVADGRIEEVSAYCERDAVATFRCLQAVSYVL